MIWILPAIVAAVIIIHVIHALTLDRLVAVKFIVFKDKKLPKELHGYKIAFISDVHEGRGLEKAAAKLNGLGVDLLILGGDFSESAFEMRRAIRILAKTQTKDGIYGVEGNHDTHSDLFAAMKENGITPLSNSGVRIRDKLFLAGTDDLWNRKPDAAAAISESRGGDFVLLVSHNPDTAMTESTLKVNLMLCGHTHGGQVAFFGFWSPHFTFTKGITKYGHRLARGWCESADGTAMYVSNGYGCGTTGVPRIFARPELVVLTLL
jgi:hypothetical protein